jgi:hypothetical protein
MLKKRLRKAWSLIRRELPPSGPHFFIVGATRAGTTWLHHALRAHPDIFMPQTKELQYFNRDSRYRPELNGYRRLFWGWRGERVVGEATPLYMAAGAVYDASGVLRIGVEDDAITRIAHHFPEAKLIVSLRDPAMRIPSIYEKNLRQRKLDEPLAQLLECELGGEPSPLNLLYANDYRVHLASIFARFPTSQVKVLLFEEWRGDPRRAVEDLQLFVGVEPSFREPTVNEAANRRERYGSLDEESIRRLSAVPEPLMIRVLERLAPSKAWLEQRLGRKLPWQ